jgi:hypothetical protein
MSDRLQLAVIGTGEMTADVTAAIRRSTTYALAGTANPNESLPEGSQVVLNLASGADQLAGIAAAADAGLPVATLPLLTTDSAARSALGQGRVVQVSPLRGFVALEAFRADVRNGVAGMPYGIFGAHRVRQGHTDLFETIGIPLLHFAFDLFDEPLVRVQTTRAALFGSDHDSWFIIARGARDLLITLEFAASLAPSAPAPEQILFEVTGDGAMLRVEPTRQVIMVSGRDGATRDVAWWPDLAPVFVDAAVQTTDIHEPGRELAFLDFVAAVRESAESGEPVEVK